MKTICVIPARLNSTRLPQKLIQPICGKPLIQHVYENICNAKNIDEIYIATDAPNIVKITEGFGGKAILTGNNHTTGTERISEVAEKIIADIYINVQGDELFIRKSDIENVIDTLKKHPNREIASLYQALAPNDIDNTNVVKAVLTNSNDALYFTRVLVKPSDGHYKHLGVYGYRRSFFERYRHIPPSVLAKSQKLEQLQFLQANIPIIMSLVSPLDGPAINTEENLILARSIMSTYR